MATAARLGEAEERVEVQRHGAARAVAEERLRIAQELHDVVRGERAVDDRLIAEREDEYRSYQALTPPRVLTSSILPRHFF